MLKVIYIVWIGLAFTGCQRSVSLFDLRNEVIGSEAVFVGSGADPSWTLNVTRSSVVFSDKIGRMEAKIDPGYFANEPQGYQSEKISFWTNLIECLDGKSRRYFSHTVTVKARGKIARGCGGVAMTGKMDHLAKTTWRLERIDGKVPIANALTQIRFAQGRMIAFVGCNRLSRDYSYRDNEITVGTLQITALACSDLEKQQEQRFLEILGQRARLDFDEFGQIIIQNPAGGMLAMSQAV